MDRNLRVADIARPSRVDNRIEVLKGMTCKWRALWYGEERTGVMMLNR